MGLLLVLVGLGLAQVRTPERGEPEPVTVLEKYGPVIDRTEAKNLGLFKYRPNFGALRFVRADSGRFEARIAARLNGVMLEQSVPLDSPALGRVEQGLVMLRDRGVTNVELLLSPSQSLDAFCLGSATDIRSATGAVLFGLLGTGAGSTVALNRAVAYPPSIDVVVNWPAYGALTLAGALLVGTAGWYVGAQADAARPARPNPRCAIAGYDDYGYPFYEEDLRHELHPQASVLVAAVGLGIGILVASQAGPAIQSSFDSHSYHPRPSLAVQLPLYTMVLGTLAVSGFLGNTLGRNIDRKIALNRLRHRPMSDRSQE